jgi:Glycosyl transferase family 2
VASSISGLYFAIVRLGPLFGRPPATDSGERNEDRRSAGGASDGTGSGVPRRNHDALPPAEQPLAAKAQNGDGTHVGAAQPNVGAPGRSRAGEDALVPQNGNGTRPRVSVVIPTLNEAKNLPYVLRELPDEVYEVVLVDGSSTDGTVEVAREHYPDVRVVGQTRRGKGNALASGFDAVRGDVIVMLDADGSADPGEISRFVDALANGADFAKGSRFLDGGGSSDITVLRRLGNKFLCGIVNSLYRTRYSDLCYGYNAFWRHCLPYINVDCDGFEVETLINIRVAKAGLRVEEVPSFERDRLFGESNLRTFRDGFRVLRTILRERAKDTPVEAATAIASAR